jgi:N-acetylmuramic acid 6-phosphate etherase
MKRRPTLPPTERAHPQAAALDRMTVPQILRLMEAEDRRVVAAVATARVRTSLARLIREVVAAFRQGGRLFYVGAGTSGRLGVLDAAECPPTFSVPPTMVQGILAGGMRALVRSREGAEDRAEEGARAIRARKVGPRDVVLGITASGLTPFVRGALREASRRGARVWLLTCNPQLRLPTYLAGVIALSVGPEILSGSTRLKAGTVTKILLNRITTTAMIRLGRVYGNLMVDVAPTSRKLRERAARIVERVTGLDGRRAGALLKAAGWSPKAAIVMHAKRLTRREAEALLQRHRGQLRKILGREVRSEG